MSGVRPYIVRQGDYVAKIAFQLGCTEDEIWSHEKNKELKEGGRTKDILAPGDVLYVPAAQAARVGVGITRDNPMTSPARSVEVRVQVSIDGEAVREQPFIAMGGAWTQTGESDADGTVTLRVPIDVPVATIVYPNTGESQEFRIGFLDPASEAQGVAQRLELLGLLSPYRDRNDAEVTGALLVFQCIESLPMTGQPDDVTVARLKSRCRV